VFFVSVADKGVSISVSLLDATLRSAFVSVASKRLGRGGILGPKSKNANPEIGVPRLGRRLPKRYYTLGAIFCQGEVEDGTGGWEGVERKEDGLGRGKGGRGLTQREQRAPRPVV
jgi:hypothetical protein